MKEYIAIDIANKINEIAKDDGVSALANYKPEMMQPGNIKCIDIELKYKDYFIVERLNTLMNINDEDVDGVVRGLLASLFNDYFASKLNVANKQ